MGWKQTAEPVLTRMPTVRRPEGHVPFKHKLAWTGAVLIVYFFLTNITIWGMGTGGGDLFGQFRSILAGAQGSILHLGIGPIVTASIVLQLLGGANLLGLDTNDPRDQVLYQGLQKVLVLVVTFMTAFPMVFAGDFLPAGEIQFAGETYTGTTVEWIMFSQIFVGGIFILYLDEIVSKWGIGSGIGLFIIAGVSQRLVGGIVSLEEGILSDWYSIATGESELGAVIGGPGFREVMIGSGHVLAIATTVFIFALVVYAESVRVEIPLSHARVKGARGRFPVKLIYASVLPMILVRALQANIQFLGRILDNATSLPAWAGVYQNGQPIGGLFYYMAPIQTREEWMWFVFPQATSAVETWQILTRIAVDMTFMVIGGAIFAIFWVETTDMGPEATAKQIHQSGMQIPGFRQNPAVVEKVMARYIPQVTVIGGALVGLLAVMANMLGTIGQVSGTGLLLTVSITYKMYEEIAEEQLMEMHPMMRQMFG